MTNHTILSLSLYQKRKGVAIANLFRCQGTTNNSQRWHMPMWSCQQNRDSGHHQFEMTHPFSTSNATEYVIHVYQTFYLFWITLQVELISLEHCSSRNRKILRHIVHTLKFLAWLSRIIKHKTPKLVAQAGLQKLRSAHDLSKVICAVVNHKRTFTIYIFIPLIWWHKMYLQTLAINCKE